MEQCVGWGGGLLRLAFSQEGTAAPSSPGPGEVVDADAEAEAQRQDEEQAYLAGLARMYHLEQYPDSYESMCE